MAVRSEGVEDELERMAQQVATIRRIVQEFPEKYARSVEAYARRMVIDDVEKIEKELKEKLSEMPSANSGPGSLRIVLAKKGAAVSFSLSRAVDEGEYPPVKQTQMGFMVVPRSFFDEIEGIKRSVQSGEVATLAKSGSDLIYEGMKKLLESTKAFPGKYY